MITLDNRVTEDLFPENIWVYLMDFGLLIMKMTLKCILPCKSFL